MTVKGAWTPQKVRDRIKVGVLTKRLQDHALGKLDMTDSQRRAIEVLLKKTLPDLSNVENTHVGVKDRPIFIQSCDGDL